jgi:hypothetical protein
MINEDAVNIVDFDGEGEEEIEKFFNLEMEPGILFNIRKNGWYCCVLSCDAVVLLVENQDTGEANTDFISP